MKTRAAIFFVLINAVVCLFVFQSAIWGKVLLAPLDIPAGAFSKYRFVDPESTGVFANGWLGDQIGYDLPIQHTIYQAYRRGEIPWWDPYTYAGRPLLADAHINGTDWVRLLCYWVLPFELAYNWTRILHFFLSGAGMFLLLRHAGARIEHAILLALAYEFAGGFTWFFGHPWIQASFVYYPFLWLAWNKALEQHFWRWQLAAAMLVAAIFYSGNLQSHAYLVLFVLAFLFGSGLRAGVWKKAVLLTSVSGLAGALMAAPVLLGQVEFFLVGVRAVVPTTRPMAWLSGLTTLTGVYPWALGTFRTLDLRNLLWYSGSGLENGVGYHLFIGSAGILLAAAGALGSKPAQAGQVRLQRTALGLFAIYFLVLSSPLIGVFYPRCAGLGVMSLIVLAAFGLDFLASSSQPYPRLGRAVGMSTLVIVLALNLGALMVYPRVLPRIRQIVQQRDAANPNLAADNRMRRFQIENLPKEISFQNPETIFAAMSLWALALVFVRPAFRQNPLAWTVLLILNALPVILYAHRFIPRHDVELWRRLLAGGPEQTRAAAILGQNRLRLWEEAPHRYEFLFPYAFSHLYRVNTIYGYSALAPKSLFGLNLMSQNGTLADYAYQSQTRGLTEGVLVAMRGSGNRFHWADGQDGDVRIEGATLNEISLRFQPGPERQLIWTDTYYPGWTAKTESGPIELDFQPPCFSRIQVPAAARRLELRYEPRFLALGKVLASLSGFGLIGMGILNYLQIRRDRP